MEQSTSRQLAAIMFTDIEGYTALMQTDETAAFQIRNRHREVFEVAHQKFNGKVIQYFGDGTLSIFNSSRDAVDCAIEMQKYFRESPEVPLRIGIHMGEIIVVKDDILGNSVNVASRIESIGVTGSVFISSKVYDSLKNQKDIEVRSMGLFEFKNIDKPKEVFAISNSDLVVPNPEMLTGKTKLKDFRKDADRNFFTIVKELWERKVFLVAGSYLIALLALVKGMNYFISNYDISPYWTDVLLVFFISFLPSVILHAYYHHRIELNNWRLAEKITIPSNVILSITLLAFLFGSKDLGATTKTIVVQDEFGNEIERTFVKGEFRKKINFYPFKNESGDSTLNWLGRGFASLISKDIVQDYYIWNNYYTHKSTLGGMIEHAQTTLTPYFITGKFEKNDSAYHVTTQLYHTKNGKLIHERRIGGKNIFDIVDKLSILLKKDLGLPEYHIQNTKDLPVKSILTDNPKAFFHFINAGLTTGLERYKHYKKANQLDPTFATSNYFYAKFLYQGQAHQKEAELAIDNAMKHRDMTSDLYDMRIRTLFYNIHNEQNKAIALREMQAELNPNDADAYNHLIGEYHKNGYFEKSLNAAKKLYELKPELIELEGTQAWLLKMLNRPEEGLKIMGQLVKRYPKNYFWFIMLGDLQLAVGNLDAAENSFNKVSLLNPELKGIENMLKHIQYVKAKGADYHPEFLKQFEGEYKWAGNEPTGRFIYEYGRLYEKPLAIRRYQAYPISDSTVILVNGAYKKTFFKNKLGQVDRYLREIGDSKIIAYKIDDSIREAEKLLLEGKDEEALVAYEEAYKKNPEHHFLNNYIQHLNFKKSGKIKNVLATWKTALGKYHNYGNVTMEGDELIWWRIEDGMRFKLLPISENEFVVLELWVTKMVLLEEKGKVTGVEWIYPSGNKETLTRVE